MFDARMKNSDQNIEQKKLLHLVSKGHRNAYRQLYEDHLSSLYRFVLPFVNHEKSEAEDVVQDVFFKIWERRERLTEIQSFKSYIFTMAKNRLIDLHKQEQTRNSILNQMDANRKEQSVHDLLVFDEYYEFAQNAIDHLTPQRKRIFLMRTQKDMSIAEIAKVLNISNSAVKKQLYESIRMVKNQLNKKHNWPMMWWVFLWTVPFMGI